MRAKKKARAEKRCSKRHRQFKQACTKKQKTPQEFYLLAAQSANPKVASATALNDFGRHQLSVDQGKFTAPAYVHAMIDRVLGLTPHRREKPSRGYLSPKRPASGAQLSA